MAGSSLHSHIEVLFSELSSTVAVAAGLDTEGATIVLGEVSSHFQELRMQVSAGVGLQQYLDIPPAQRPSDPDISLEGCKKNVREALGRFIRGVAFSDPDADTPYRISRVASYLEYAQKHHKQYLAPRRRPRASLASTTALPAPIAFPAATTFGAPQQAAQASARRQPQSSSTWTVPGTCMSPPLPNTSQSVATPPWIAGIPPPPFPPSLVGHDDEDDLQCRQQLLEMENTLRSLHARATSGIRWRQASERITELVFLGSNFDVAAADIPTMKMLCEAAPNLVRLSINAPIAPWISAPAFPLELQYLLVDEANVVWTMNRMASTLRALNASDIPELHLRNASLATLRKCLAYLKRSTTCRIVDDAGLRYINLVDRHRTHLYVGAFVATTSFVFTSKTLADVTSLALCDQMLTEDLNELFGRAFPRDLHELRVWFGAEYRPQESRERLLAYRSAGWGRCKALALLTLTVTPPVDIIAPRREMPVPTVRRSLLRQFVHHIHGGDFAAMAKVKVLQDGVEILDA